MYPPNGWRPLLRGILDPAPVFIYTNFSQLRQSLQFCEILILKFSKMNQQQRHLPPGGVELAINWLLDSWRCSN